MELWQQFFQEKQVERTIQALKKNNFEAIFVPDRRTAVDWVMKQIPDGASVGIGGSLTLNQIGLMDALKTRNIQLIWPHAQAKNDEERKELNRRCFLTDVFLTGTNAITEDGKLFNIDATGNRVGAMFVGPKKVLVISGTNKIVKDIQAAEERLRYWAAPQNAKRLNRKTPCTETGVCADCSSPDRICNIYVTVAKRPTRTNIVVVLIGESLGI